MCFDKKKKNDPLLTHFKQRVSSILKLSVNWTAVWLNPSPFFPSSSSLGVECLTFVCYPEIKSSYFSLAASKGRKDQLSKDGQVLAADAMIRPSFLENKCVCLCDCFCMLGCFSLGCVSWWFCLCHRVSKLKKPMFWSWLKLLSLVETWEGCRLSFILENTGFL